MGRFVNGEVGGDPAHRSASWASGVEGPVLRARPDRRWGKFFTRPYIPRPPRLVHKVGGLGWFAPAKGAKYGVLWAPVLCGSMSGKPVSTGDGVCTTNLINTPVTKQRIRLNLP